MIVPINPLSGPLSSGAAARPTPLAERVRQRMEEEVEQPDPGVGPGPDPDPGVEPDPGAGDGCNLPYDPELTPERNAMRCPILKMAKQDFMEKLMFGEEEETGVPALSIDI